MQTADCLIFRNFFSGFTVVKELTLDVQNVIAPPKQKSKSVQKEKGAAVDSQKVAPAPDADTKEGTKEGGSEPDPDTKGEKPPSMDETAVENGSTHDNKSEGESAKSAPNSPFASSVIGSPKESMDSNFGKAAGFDASPRDKDAHRYCQQSFSS